MKSHPKTIAVVIAVCAAIAIGVGVGVGVGKKNDSNNNDQVAQDPSAMDYTVTFQVQGTAEAPPTCAAFQDPTVLAGYATTIQGAISTAINVPDSQVGVRSVRCGNVVYTQQQWGTASSGRRMLLAALARMLQQADAGTGAEPLSLTVLFRLTGPSLPSSDQVAASLQAQQGRLVLQQATQGALGNPSNSVSLVTVEAVPISDGGSGGAATDVTPPAAAPTPLVEGPPPALGSSPSTSSPTSGYYGGYYGPAPTPVPTYGSPVPAYA